MRKRKHKAYDEAGLPLYVRCYDDGGESFDRYTVVFTRLNLGRGWQFYLAMSSHPFSPQGFGQHGEGARIDTPTYRHLGKKVTFSALPEDCQKCVMQDYREYWGEFNV